MTVQGHGWDDNVGAPLNRNRIINGSFSVDQRNAGATQTITAGAALAYTADRWYAYCTGANVTGQRTAGTAPFQYNYRFTGAASNTLIGFGTRLQAADTFYMAGTTVTLSAYVASSSLTSITWTAYYANSTDSFGTVASPTRTQIATGSFTVSSTLTRRSVSISVPSAATTGIEILFTTGALTASNTLSFAGVQLEAGSIATPFEFEPFETTLHKCLRYFEKSYSYDTVPGTNQGAFPTICVNVPFTTGLIQTDGWGGGRTIFTRQKRNSTPVISVYNEGGTVNAATNVHSGGSTGLTNPTVLGNDKGFMVQTGGGTAGNVCKMVYHWVCNAEL